jgi:hypothetical protein
VAVRLAWICQTLLDPRYSCIESIEDSSNNKAHAVQLELSNQSQSSTAQQKHPLQQQQQHPPASQSEASVAAAPERMSRAAARLAAAKSNSLPPTLAKRSPDYGSSLHQENRNRRAAQLRFRTRPSSFDAALIVRGGKSSVIVASPTPSPLRRRNMRVWDITSSSGCSSDSASNSDSDSETELRVSENVSNEEGSTHLVMSPEEEEIFRLTVGRGHLSRSKKERFLNHLRLEKRLNDLSNEYFGIACKSHHRGALQRRHSGELHRII